MPLGLSEGHIITLMVILCSVISAKLAQGPTTYMWTYSPKFTRLRRCLWRLDGRILQTSGTLLAWYVRSRYYLSRTNADLWSYGKWSRPSICSSDTTRKVSTTTDVTCMRSYVYSMNPHQNSSNGARTHGASSMRTVSPQSNYTIFTKAI